jgi:hypothetical protein
MAAEKRPFIPPPSSERILKGRFESQLRGSDKEGVDIEG